MKKKTSLKCVRQYIFYNNPKYIDFNISQMPNQIRNKLYILCMRNFWRSYVPLTAQDHSWQTHALHIQDMLYKAHKNNIHFLHLPFNTLYENRDYIVGCQCIKCLTSPKRAWEQNTEQKWWLKPKYYKRRHAKTDSYWNDTYEYFLKDEDEEDTEGMVVGLPIFNPFHDIFTLEDKIRGLPIYFTKDNYLINLDPVSE